MEYFLLKFLILILLSALIDGLVESHLKYCGLDRVEYLKLSDEYHFSVNEKRVEEQVLICDALNSYLENGCLCDDVEWQEIGNILCHGFQNNQSTASACILQREGRKLLHHFIANSTVIKPINSKTDKNEEKSSAPAKMALAIPAVFLLCCALICPCFHAKNKKASEQGIMFSQVNSMNSVSIDISSTSEKAPGTPSRFLISQQENKIGTLQLSVNQIIKVTKNFSNSLKVGEGGYGSVYKAVLPNGQIVAMKRAKKDLFASPIDEFSNEVELLTKIDHRNLVRLLGYTDKGDERIIITEYVPNGTLRGHLDGQYGKILNFNERLELAIDVAHALTYLHLYAEKPIIHRDVKSSNILLTESLRAKVSDFGFAIVGPTEVDQTHIITRVKGTAGYLDPEYLQTHKLTPKSDVFSFGILLIEILSARRPVELNRDPSEKITIRWAFRKYDEGKVGDIIDPLLREAVDMRVVKEMLGLAFECAAPTRADRPNMKEVGEKLWEIRKAYIRTQT